MFSVNVWTWTWPTRNGLTALTRQVVRTHWSSRGQKLLFQQRKQRHTTPYSAINHKLLHALCKKCSTDCQYFLNSSHKPIASVLFWWVSESLSFSGNYFFLFFFLTSTGSNTHNAFPSTSHSWHLLYMSPAPYSKNTKIHRSMQTLHVSLLILLYTFNRCPQWNTKWKR